jgi:hypothetical protein
LKGLASPPFIISQEFSIVAEIGAAVVPSIDKFLGKQRNKAAIEARAQLEGILRRNLVFG